MSEGASLDVLVSDNSDTVVDGAPDVGWGAAVHALGIGDADPLNAGASQDGAGWGAALDDGSEAPGLLVQRSLTPKLADLRSS